MRENPVGCINQTLQQHLAGVHTTFEDDRICARCAMRRPFPPASPGSGPGRAAGRSSLLPRSASSTATGGIPCDDESNTTRLRSGSSSPH